jgi:hypothetical protein
MLRAMIPGSNDCQDIERGSFGLKILPNYDVVDNHNPCVSLPPWLWDTVAGNGGENEDHQYCVNAS